VWGEAGNKTSTRHIQTVLTEFPVSAKPPCWRTGFTKQKSYKAVLSFMVIKEAPGMSIHAHSQ
jgi:hypothetical protein